jgi:outer membrane protein insertion porin family
VTFYEPDIFRRHRDTIGLRVRGYRSIRFLDSYLSDGLGANVGLDRQFTDEFSAGISVRQESNEVFNLDRNAPTFVYQDEGTTELRGIQVNLAYEDTDRPIAPTTGFWTRFYSEVLGGVFGADKSIFKTGVSGSVFLPVYRDNLDRAHVLEMRAQFDYATDYSSDPNAHVYSPERFYMGGSTLRGFRQRRAGPSQFGNPVGGEVRLLSKLEYQFPIYSTQRPGQLRQTEHLRGVFFTDFGMLGLGMEDFGPPRLTAGFGLRVRVPLFELPIQLDFGWPILDENTDEAQQVFFRLQRF